MMQTLLQQMQQSNRKHSGASTILLTLSFGILRIVAIKIDYSRLGWEDHDLLIMNPSRDTLLSCILSLWTPNIILR